MVRVYDPPMLFIHMPKTSGMWWRAVLLAVPGARRLAGTHSPGVVALPHIRKGARAFGVLRDPLSWYASLWTHILDSDDDRRALLARGWGSNSLDFAAVLDGWTSGRLPREVAHCPGVLWRQTAKRRIRWQDGEGLWSFAMRYFFQDNTDAWIVDELIPMTAGVKRATEWGFNAPGPRNTSDQRHAVRPDRVASVPNITPEMRAQVERADGAMFRSAQAIVRRAAA